MNSLCHRLQNIQILIIRKLPGRCSSSTSQIHRTLETALLPHRRSVSITKRGGAALPPQLSSVPDVSPRRTMRRDGMRSLPDLRGYLEPRHLLLQMLLILLKLEYLLEQLLRGWSLHCSIESGAERVESGIVRVESERSS